MQDNSQTFVCRTTNDVNIVYWTRAFKTKHKEHGIYRRKV